MVSRSLSGIMVKDEGSDGVGVDEEAMLVIMQLLSWAAQRQAAATRKPASTELGLVSRSLRPEDARTSEAFGPPSRAAK